MTRRLVAVVAVVAGLAAWLAVDVGVARVRGPLATVVVTRSAVPAGAVLAADQLSTATVPAADLPPGVLRSAAEASGQATAVDLPPGSWVLANELAAAGPPTGRQAVAVPLATGHYPGFLAPGSRVDVLVVLAPAGPGNPGAVQALVVTRQALVLGMLDAAGNSWTRGGAGGWTGGGQGPAAVVVAVPPAAALRLAWAITAGSVFVVADGPPAGGH